MFILGVLLQIWLVGSVITFFTILVLGLLSREDPPPEPDPLAPTLLTTGLLRKLK